MPALIIDEVLLVFSAALYGVEIVTRLTKRFTFSVLSFTHHQCDVGFTALFALAHAVSMCCCNQFDSPN